LSLRGSFAAVAIRVVGVGNGSGLLIRLFPYVIPAKAGIYPGIRYCECKFSVVLRVPYSLLSLRGSFTAVEYLLVELDMKPVKTLSETRLLQLVG